MSGIWIIDCEGDGLNPTKIYCLAAAIPESPKDVSVTSSYNNMRKLLTEADVLICHNMVRFDKPVLERILGIEIKAKLVDTLALSWYLYPTRNRHGLESWGETFGVPKPPITDWIGLSQEEYENRCVEDVKINALTWNRMFQYLIELYGSQKEVWRILDYITFKMKCAYLQEKSKWKLDVEYAQKSLKELEDLRSEKTEILRRVMPKVPSTVVKSKPKRFLNKSGGYTKLGQDWIKLLSSLGLPPNHDLDVEITVGYEDGNPNSPEQLKNWLYSLGWNPRTLKHVKNKSTGEIKSIPQINLEHGKGICNSIKDLYEKEPNLELLDGLSVLQHRIGILKGFLRDQEDGWLKAQIKGFTNTLRVQHTTIVNLPKVDKAFAEPIRSSLIAPKGKILCGSDMSSLEDRIKQHFIYPHDPEYVNEMNKPDFDPHLIIAGMAKMLTQEEIQKYKDGDKTKKPIRDIAKNGNYACQYGAGPPRLVLTCGISLEQARILHKAYWDLNWAIKAVVEEQIVKSVNDQMWLYNPISRFWYSLRYEKDIFSTLVQGTASYVFDLWIEYILEDREELTATFHDEIVLCTEEGYSTYNKETKKWEGPIVDFLKDKIHKVNEKLKLNRELDIDVQFGYRYSHIH